MIEKLKSKDIGEAAKVYYKGMLMETPKGRASLDAVIKHLKEVCTFVYKENKKIKGLISFKLRKDNAIQVDFICAVTLRKGIGKKLLKKLAIFCLKNEKRTIYSDVSSKDTRVILFYEKYGFKKYSKYYARKNFMLYRIKAAPEQVLKKISA